jgi:hypothetical protein
MRKFLECRFFEPALTYAMKKKRGVENKILSEILKMLLV